MIKSILAKYQISYQADIIKFLQKAITNLKIYKNRCRLSYILLR